MNTLIKGLFQLIVSRIESIEPRTRDTLNPGLDERAISSVAEDIGLPISGEVYDLFMLVNGVNHRVIENTEIMFNVVFPAYFSYYMLSIEEVKDSLSYFKSVDYYDGEIMPTWLPLFADNMGNYIFVDTMSSVLVSVTTDSSPAESKNVMYKSISSMLRCIVLYFDEGGYINDADGGIIEDVEKINQITFREESLPYWRH